MNTSYKEYSRLAYRRTILAAIQRFLQEHLSSETPATQQLLCEEVLASDRDVPPEAFLEMIEELQFEEQKVRLEFAEYEFRRKDVSRKQEEPQSPVVQASKAPTGPVKSKPGGLGS